jgi:diaminohydroxyphosphoribosylaminopyrimidine deaminase/5-amino-6-(5-phosphoribosylamino)uracil reductase
MVGSVIVYNNQIIGEGYHEVFGGPHAEVNAIASVAAENKHLLSHSTIYVSLEPCNHVGKTPACSDFIIRNKIPKVVVGCIDPFEKVAGSGIKKLQENGIEVQVGVLEKECLELNKRFFTFHLKQRPYITLKWAQSKDGFLDIDRSGNAERKVNWITNQDAKVLVHTWRSEEHGILVGKNTVLKDNPSLTVREVVGKNPIRILLDSKLEAPLDSAIFNNDANTLVINTIKEEVKDHLTFIKMDRMDISSILTTLFQANIQSVFVEGGAKVLQAFIDANSWDEAHVLTGEICFNKGVSAPTLAKMPTSTKKFAHTHISHYINS